MTDLSQKLECLQSQYDLLKCDNDNLQSHFESLKRQLASSNTLVLSLQHQISKQKREHDTYTSICQQQSRSEIDSVRSEYSKTYKDLVREREKIEENLIECNSSCFSLQQENSKLKFKLEQSERRLRQIEESLGVVEGKKSLFELTNQLQNSGNVIAQLSLELTNERNNFDSHIEILDRKISSLTHELEKKDKLNAELRKASVDLEDQILAFKTQSVELDERAKLIENLNARMVDELKKNVLLKSEKIRLNDKCTALEIENQKLLEEVNKIEANVNSRKVKLETMERNLEMREKNLRIAQMSRDENVVSKLEFDELKQRYEFLSQRIDAFTQFLSRIPQKFNVSEEPSNNVTKLNGQLKVFGEMIKRVLDE